MRFVVLACALLGCKSDALPADCTTVSTGIKKYWADRAAVATEDDERAAIVETTQQASERFERHCRADRWSDEMIACARTVFRLDDSGCMKFLSSAQRVKWEAPDVAPLPGGGIGVGGTR